MLKKWDVTIPSLTGDKPRRAYVYLPEYYDDDPNRRFPVMYMFDGQNIFLDEDASYGKSWGMYHFMNWTRKPLIIVAVECNRFGERFNEYAPVTHENLVLFAVFPQKVFPVAAFRGRAVDQGHVFFDHAAFLDGFGQGSGGLFGAGIDHDAAHVFVQAVDGEDLAAQGFFQRGGNVGFRIKSHGLDADGDITVGKKNFHGNLQRKRFAGEGLTPPTAFRD